MNSFIPWVGGKGKLLWIINKLMPDRYTRFIDVFGGSGTVTMCRPIQRGCMVIAEYFRVNIIVQGVRDAVQQAVIATVNENYDDVYHSVREGYAAGWFPEGDGEWFESIDAGDIYGNLSYILGLTSDGEGYMKYAGNELEYTLSDLSVHISNNAIASGRSEGYLATATLHLEVPTRFAGRVLPPVSLNLQVQAKYIPKF